MTSIADRLVFALANASVWLTDPIFALYSTARLRRIPDFARPRRHNDLVQWRKHFDRNPLFGTFCDKLAARDWARARVPEVKTVEVVWVGTDPDAIPPEFLSDGYVVKSTCGSGRNYFPGRGRWTPEQQARRFRRWLRPSGGRGEWGYTVVRPRLFVERLLGKPEDLYELNLRCHDGRVTLGFCANSWKTARAAGAYVTGQGRRIDAWTDDARWLAESEIVPHELFERAARYASRISEGIDQLRVDFLIAGGELYLGELTVYSASGFGDEERVGVGTLIERAWLGAIARSSLLATPQRGLRARYAEAFRRWVPARLAELSGASAVQADLDAYLPREADAQDHPAASTKR